MLRCEFFKVLQESDSGKKYLALIEEARQNPPDERGEDHHIYPRSFEEGEIKEDNIIRLSVQDHILAHYYLADSIPCTSTFHAFRMMWDRCIKKLPKPDQEFFSHLEKVSEFRKLGRIKSPETLEKQRQRALGRIHINNGSQEKKIYPKDLQRFIDEGWKVGRVIRVHNPSAGRIWVHFGEEKEEVILPEQLQSYLDSGWVRGRKRNPTKGKIRISRGEEVRYATAETLDQMLAEGFIVGVRSNMPRYRVDKDGKVRYILEKDLDGAIQSGWKLKVKKK